MTIFWYSPNTRVFHKVFDGFREINFFWSISTIKGKLRDTLGVEGEGMRIRYVWKWRNAKCDLTYNLNSDPTYIQLTIHQILKTYANAVCWACYKPFHQLISSWPSLKWSSEKCPTWYHDNCISKNKAFVDHFWTIFIICVHQKIILTQIKVDRWLPLQKWFVPCLVVRQRQ